MRYIKYLNQESAIKFLESATLKFSLLTEFNDPFEGNLLICSKSNLVKDNLELEIDLFNHSKIFSKYEISESEDITNYNFWDEEELLNELCNGTDAIACLCLSRSAKGTADNMLMWAHYARDHKGIAIAFNPNHPYFTHVDEVNYSDRKMILDARILVEHSKSFPINTFFPKDKCWQYEDEVRLSKWRRDLIETVKADSVVFTDNIPLDSIQEIFIGCNATESTRHLVSNFCKKHSIPVISFKKKLTSYGLIFDGNIVDKDNLSAKEHFEKYANYMLRY